MEMVATPDMVDDDGVLVAKFRARGINGGDNLADLFRMVWDE